MLGGGLPSAQDVDVAGVFELGEDVCVGVCVLGLCFYAILEFCVERLVRGIGQGGVVLQAEAGEFGDGHFDLFY